ncbi:hypothetical protein KJ966_11115 [bacterium]|nr:hypothetical protein [bacterium]
MDYVIKTDKSHSIQIEKETSLSDSYRIKVGENSYQVSIIEFHPNGQIKTLVVNQQIIPVDIEKQADGSLTTVFLKGIPYDIEVEKKKSILTRPAAPIRVICGDIRSSLPGQVLDILVNLGDEVKKGQPVVLLESMKMENEILSPKSGTVIEILVEIGQNVKKNDNLIVIG